MTDYTSLYRQKKGTVDDALGCISSDMVVYFASDCNEPIALLKRLHGLEEPLREVMYLRAFGALSFREIGDILGRTENWARVTFYRGKERLKKEMIPDEN